MPSASAHVIAVDLGGTQFRVALFDAAGRLLRREAFPTHGEQGPAAVLDRIAAGCRDMLTQLPAGGSLAGVGVAAPSPIDPKRGVVFQAPNLPGWVDIPLRDELARRLDLPVLAGNDANLAALGEWRFGAGRDHGDLVYLTISTGVGSGFVSAGRLLVGHSGLAGEAGHMVLQLDGPLCSCGKHGCFEALASGTAIHREAVRRAPLAPDSALGRRDPLTAAAVDEEAERGDPLARELMEAAGRATGAGVASLVHIFDPDIVVIGGGVSRSGPLWWDAVQRSAREHVLLAYLPGLRIVPAGLGDDAGLFGAAAAVLNPAAAGA